jgi:hypothetical protein
MSVMLFCWRVVVEEVVYQAGGDAAGRKFDFPHVFFCFFPRPFLLLLHT